MDRLAFYSKSKDVPPGSGAQEYVKHPEDYIELKNIPNWRRILSNFHVYDFTYKNHTYRTIEHVFQAEKIVLADPQKAYLFTIESQSEIGLGDGTIAQKNRKLVNLTKEQLKVWDTIKMNVMRDAAIAKYKACKEARDVLKATLNAELWHVVSRSKPVRFIHLEKIRLKI